MSLLSCRKFTELSSRALEMPLSAWEKFQHRFHFCLCFTCRRFERQITLMDKILKSIHAHDRFHEIDENPGRPVRGLSDEAKERIKQSLGPLH